MDSKCLMNSYWYEMMSFAMNSNTIETWNAFRVWIINLAGRFPCEKCRGHFQKYVIDNPVKKAQHPVMWVWKFHNNVNERLGKRPLGLREAVTAFVTNQNCESCKV